MNASDILIKTTNYYDLDFNDLTSIQIGAMRAIHDGRLDCDTASDRMLDIIYELQNIGIVDEIFDLTEIGHKMVGLALQVGGFERRKAATRAATKVDIESLCDGTEDDNLDDEW